jgi:hypothetical protein
MRNANLIVKAGMLATCLPFIGCNSANKSEKSQEERPNILFILSDDQARHGVSMEVFWPTM